MHLPSLSRIICFSFIIVRSEEEVGASSNDTVDPVDLNQFFGEDGKIYGYKGLKVISSKDMGY